jgi:hypothetical protein
MMKLKFDPSLAYQIDGPSRKCRSSAVTAMSHWKPTNKPPARVSI